MTPVSTRVPVTFFSSFHAADKEEQNLTLDALRDKIATTSRAKKDWLPWLKLATFGDIRTDKNSLRHDGNVQSISGVEVDYDDEQISPSAAIERLTKAGILSIFYTSPSHTEDSPRWRVLAPTSGPLPPGERKKLVGRLNGVFGGIFAHESWALSQAYYFGSINNNPSHIVEVIDGEPIDTLDELDEIWIGPANTKQPSSGTKVGKLDEAACLQAIVDGQSYHEASMRLLGKWADAGMPREEARAKLTSAMDGVFPLDRDDRWKKRRADIGRCLDFVFLKEARERDVKADVKKVNPAQASAAKHETDAESWSVINPRSLLHLPIPERRFIVGGWLAAGTVTINFGDGGVGKTLLTQQIMTSTATGLPWIGLAVERCRSLALFCEDDEDELHRRQHAINLAYGIGFDALDDMEWISGVGHDNALCTFDSDGTMQVTSKFLTFEKRAKETGAGLLIIDTAADTFGGNEILRRQVRQFMGKALGGLAKETGAAVIINAHPSRAGLGKEGDQDGGSTAWSNTARARWALTRPKPEAGDEPADTNERILSRRKSNYSSTGDSLKLRWQSGVLVPANGPSGLSALAANANADAVFLGLLDKAEASSIRVSHSKTAANFAPKIFSASPDRSGQGKRELEQAMQRLFAAGALKLIAYGRKGDDRQRIGRAEWS